MIWLIKLGSAILGFVAGVIMFCMINLKYDLFSKREKSNYEKAMDRTITISGGAFCSVLIFNFIGHEQSVSMQPYMFFIIPLVIIVSFLVGFTIYSLSFYSVYKKQFWECSNEEKYHHFLYMFLAALITFLGFAASYYAIFM